MQVLSPAGSLESFYSALNNGADEIYMGINAFNARAKADEIDYESLSKAIIDAHILGVKVFCTLNTLIYNEELEKVVKTILQAINLGFDAFIVQDLAVVQLIKEIKPDAVLHFSTQMGIHNSFGALIAKQMGAKRIVLSRECSLNDIKAIKKAVPDMEIEYFVQGALCVAFSGNCYLSNRLLGKSGNRGECAQLCRLPYIAKMGESVIGKEFYLSTGDLCLYKHLKELKDAGVDSIKIEGRLRRPSYVGKATEFYRKAVDFILNKERQSNGIAKKEEKSENYGVTDKDLEELKTTFNRGNFLYDAYLNVENYDNIIYSKMQNHMGVNIGKVLKCEKFKNINKITLQLKKEIAFGDGLKIIRNGNEVASIGVGNVENLGENIIIYSKQTVQKGDSVHLIHSEMLEKRLTSNKRQCKIDFEVVLKEGERACITATIKSLNSTFSVLSQDVLEKAKNSAVTENDVLVSINKINDAIFMVGDVKITLDNVFIAKSSLNALRRELIEKIRESFKQKQIDENVNDVIGKIISNFSTLNEQGVAKSESIESEKDFCTLKLKRCLDLSKANKGKACKEENVAFFPYEFLSKSTFDEMENFLNSCTKDLYIFLPPFVLDYDLTLWIDKMVENFSNYKSRIFIIANNISHMYLSKYFSVIAGDFCNITNKLSALYYKKLGAKGVCLGYEFKDRNALSKGFKVDYKIEDNNILCFMSHCPFKAVTHTTCKQCKYCKTLSYTNERGIKYNIDRYRFSRCYFFLT